MSSIRRDIEKRAQEAILKSIIESYKQRRSDWLKEPSIRKAIFLASFFGTTNAVLIASIILIFGCLTLLVLPALPLGVGWLVLSGIGGILTLVIAEAIFLYLSFKDEKKHAEAVAELFKPEVNFDPAGIRDKELKTRVDKALEYWSLIDETVSKVPKGVLRDRLLRTTQEVTHWLQAVYNLAQRVEKFRLNKVIERDLHSVPLAIKDYEQKLAVEDSPAVRRQLEKTLADRKRQLQTLQNLKDSMEKADYQLDSTISSLGTIYSQLLLVGSKDEEGSRINRLQEEVSEQVHRLEDLADAMDEVYESSV